MFAHQPPISVTSMQSTLLLGDGNASCHCHASRHTRSKLPCLAHELVTNMGTSQKPYSIISTIGGLRVQPTRPPRAKVIRSVPMWEPSQALMQPPEAHPESSDPINNPEKGVFLFKISSGTKKNALPKLLPTRKLLSFAAFPLMCISSASPYEILFSGCMPIHRI